MVKTGDDARAQCRAITKTASDRNFTLDRDVDPERLCRAVLKKQFHRLASERFCGRTISGGDLWGNVDMAVAPAGNRNPVVQRESQAKRVKARSKVRGRAGDGDGGRIHGGSM